MLSIGFIAANGNNPVLEAEPANFLVAELNESVAVKVSAAEVFSEIDEQMKVAEGAELQTSVTGRASVLYPNGTITNIGENSTVVLKDVSADGRASHIALLAGSVFAKVKSVAGIGEGYEVGTPNMVAAVRGTVLAMSHIANVSTLYVLEGTVEAVPLNEEGDPDFDRKISVFAGEKVIADVMTQAGEESLQVKKIEAADFEMPILKNNDARSILNLPKPAGAIPSATITPVPTDIQPAVSTPEPVSSSPTITAVVPSKIDFSVTSDTGIASAGERAGASPNEKPTLLTTALETKTAMVTLRGANLHIVTAVVLGKISVPFSTVGKNTITFNVTEAMDAGTYGISLVAIGGKIYDFPGALQIIK